MSMENYFDSAFRYLEETEYKNNEVLRKQLQKIKEKVAKDFLNSGSSFEMVFKSSDLLNSINECAVDLISLMELFKHILKNEDKELGTYSYEQDQFLFINDYFMNTLISMMPKGSELNMNFCNDDDEND